VSEGGEEREIRRGVRRRRGRLGRLSEGGEGDWEGCQEDEREIRRVKGRGEVRGNIGREGVGDGQRK
jgi:hypothetical protein